jgi:hypothetical protein
MTIIQGNFGRGKKSFPSKSGDQPALLFQFHVSLAFSEPLVWRRIEVPGTLSLQQFHEVLQVCMGWSGRHGHQFYVGKIFYEMSTAGGGDKEYDEAKFELQSLQEGMKWCFTYLYDAGDGWEHDIVLELVRQALPGESHPVVVDGEWAAPPEESAGGDAFNTSVHTPTVPINAVSPGNRPRQGVAGNGPAFFDCQGINNRLKTLFGK